MGLLIAIAWFVLTIACGYIAAQRGRSPLIWGLIAVVLSPLFAYLVLVAIPRVEKRRESDAAAPKWLTGDRDETPIFKDPR